MAIIKGGASGALIDVGANTKAARTEGRPTDVGTLGSYSIDTVSGTMAAGLATASPIYSCRWGDATRSMLVRKVSLYAANLTTAFAAGAVTFDMIVARSFTASDTGGASILPTGSSQKRRTSFGTTLITDLRQSATATLAAGTRTLDAQPLAALRGYVPATAINYVFVGGSGGTISVPGASTTGGAVQPTALWAPDFGGEWPLVLVVNEGFIIRATVPATGTWTFGVAMEWSEVLSTAGFN